VTIGLLYVGLLVLGVVYAAVAGALGWIADLGEGDIHVDASGHLDAGHPHPISGTTMATFITGFGPGGVAIARGRWVVIERTSGPTAWVRLKD
jgi:hypothetical protein